MITAAPVDSAGSDGWAQTGYIQAGAAAPAMPGSGIHYVSQFTRKCKLHGTCGSASPYTTVFVGTPSGSQLYAAYLRASDDLIHMTVGSTQIDQLNYDVTGDWVSAWRAEYGAETYHHADDVPGTAADVTSFDYLQRYTSSGTLEFISSLSDTAIPVSRYHRKNTSPSVGGLGFNVWTDPL